MEVRARLEQTFSLSPYPGPRSLRSLSFPAGVRALWTATAAPALEAQHGGVHRRWRALPRVLCGVSAPRGVLPQPYKEFGGAGAAPPAGLRRPLLPPPAGRAAGTQPLCARGPGADFDGAERRAPREAASRPQGPDGPARRLGPLGQGPESLSAASPCPPCSGNPAGAAGSRARPSRSTWPSWGAAERASPVSGAGAGEGWGLAAGRGAGGGIRALWA